MKISTRGRYGLRAMVDIAIESADGTCVSLKSIATRQGISVNYLEQIIASLKKEGFVESVRGAQGGYILNRNPEELTVGDILRVLEGSLSPVECVTGESVCGTSNCDKCLTKSVWHRLYDSVNDVVDSITLQDLVNDEINE